MIYPSLVIFCFRGSLLLDFSFFTRTRHVMVCLTNALCSRFGSSPKIFDCFDPESMQLQYKKWKVLNCPQSSFNSVWAHGRMQNWHLWFLLVVSCTDGDTGSPSQCRMQNLKFESKIETHSFKVRVVQEESWFAVAALAIASGVSQSFSCACCRMLDSLMLLLRLIILHSFARKQPGMLHHAFHFVQPYLGDVRSELGQKST